MNNLELELLRKSIEALKPYANEATEFFYAHLLKTNPSLAPFLGDNRISSQKNTLFKSLVSIVELADKPEKLKPLLRAMGHAHVGFGIESCHYAPVTASLLSTLSYFFDSTWTPEMAKAWTEFLNLSSGVMTEAQNDILEKSTEKLWNSEIQRLVNEAVDRAFETILAHPSTAEMAQKKARAVLNQAFERELVSIKEKMFAKKAA